MVEENSFICLHIMRYRRTTESCRGELNSTAINTCSNFLSPRVFFSILKSQSAAITIVQHFNVKA
ncbi:hypothetical protein AB205_0002820 [Aquarana catesbeiana]|uniref:Uncharacterized protein n=1 Tax=Aquarana catesbeiana TaxID=8400 RepID=A0A2G9S1Q3_AQUCT|nr:hypothetical protein AB205_0002820 [Aquarana catesbeiana]